MARIAATRRPVLATASLACPCVNDRACRRRLAWIFLPARWSACGSEFDMAGQPRAALQVLRRRHRRERPELADEVGLIEVAEIGGDRGAQCGAGVEPAAARPAAVAPADRPSAPAPPRRGTPPPASSVRARSSSGLPRRASTGHVAMARKDGPHPAVRFERRELCKRCNRNDSKKRDPVRGDGDRDQLFVQRSPCRPQTAGRGRRRNSPTRPAGFRGTAMPLRA